MTFTKYEMKTLSRRELEASEASEFTRQEKSLFLFSPKSRNPSLQKMTKRRREKSDAFLLTRKLVFRNFALLNIYAFKPFYSVHTAIFLHPCASCFIFLLAGSKSSSPSLLRGGLSSSCFLLRGGSKTIEYLGSS